MTASIPCAGCKHGFSETALFCPNCGRPKVRESATDALVGKILGERFQIQALLGQGASGTIYRAEHVTLRRKVAIKVLHTELSRDDLAIERFRREATTVAEIDNEHIVEIHDFGRTPDGRLYLAMELLEGETLDATLAREKQLSVERAADVLIQVGEALMEAHAIGYVHRDLRPRNLYLAVRRGKANFVKLLDFGLAKIVEADSQGAASTSLGMTFGDPRYMSPEQARGDRIDRRADIYQLGCVAYEMLTGAPPFAGNRVFDILTKQVTEAPAPLPTRRPGVPLWMEAAVAKMLAKDPENRFATTTRMVEALRRGLETGEVMDDEIARRRESIPPPSVSRVMQRMGISPDAPVPSEPLTAPVPAPEAAAAPVDAPPAPASVAPVAEPPRRTGTPKVGVPALGPASASASSSVDQSPVAGTIERAKQPSDDSGGISQVWYDEGEGDASPRKVASPSTTDVSLYDEPPPRRRKVGALIAVGGLLLVGGLAFALTRGDGSSHKPAEKPAEPVIAAITVDAAPSTIIEAPVDAAPTRVTPPVDSIKRPTQAKIDTTPTPKGDRRPGNLSDFAPPDRTPGPNPIAAKDPVRDPVKITPPVGPSGVDGPLDPYGGNPDAPPSEGASTDKKAEFYANLGASQLINGDTAGAASNFKHALELDAKNVPATIGMGEIALRQGLFGDAIAHLKKASRLAPRSARVFTDLGEAYLNAGNSSEAATNFKKALQIDPDNARARDGYNEASSRVPPTDDE